MAAPRYIVKLESNYVLWFEKSNQYVVVSEMIKDLLEVFLLIPSKSEFIAVLVEQHIADNQATAFYNEIKGLLEDANTTAELPSTISPTIAITSPKMVRQYQFGTNSISVNYGSSDIENLIHPQWAHAAGVSHKNTSTTFDLFQEGEQLYLFKNDLYIGTYRESDYHLLQGQFSFQLINALYQKVESDWIATFHASTVCNDEEAIMIIGASGNGKSTLSSVLMAAGIDVLADDFTPLLAQNKEVYRFPSGISVKEGAFKMLEQLYPDFKCYPLHKSTSKDVIIKYIPPIKTLGEGITHVPCKKIVYVKYDPNATSSIKQISTEKILETLIPESWLSPLASNAELFLEWLQDLKGYELIYSDNTMAVSKFRELFKV
ncbi:hypothetical protein ES711_04805 [Gelidibacter salicanalis]|uniref:Serine kinase n=1 Tax=Gelidibacter salicanalis TaxID=291193 RepID=A0A5C7ALE9_9FLAO|nr:hypothetical protein [Gelidibacter salicanalis]TXE09251.1 hypothetical protein ES711_04805 [Gelidibacter salicanalis]